VRAPPDGRSGGGEADRTGGASGQAPSGFPYAVRPI